ncbi:uncharacterized protein K02A2.6-like [Drosophila ficusphila]|uniref:uncharacterized protein K02A2.6-like n=1 Tax=Drosophila ficusphila TaxID=30025 RepID=UPI001C8AD31A|nr:uncharacterized protein K02A2.6-like [Drosophila ficusphila]
MDSGATASVINSNTYALLKKPKLHKCSRVLHAFGHTPIPLLAELHTVAKCGEEETSTNLFGMDLFNVFGFDIMQVSNIYEVHNDKVSDLCNKYSEVFEPAMGVITDFKASVFLKSSATPKFYKSRIIPFGQMDKFKAEADRLTQAGIWKPVKFSNWASPIVLAPKPGGDIRICGDFKQAVNAQIDVELYPLPTKEALFHIIRHGKQFSKIDLKDAYLQMELDEASKEIMVVNTPVGLFQYQRLPYGIASAPAIFQRYLEQLLKGIEGCGNYLDDIMISAPTSEEHLNRIDQVLSTLQANGIRCKRQKCFFFKDEIEYLGRRISANGILADSSGLEALAAPLNQLRRKDVALFFGPQQQQAFTALKSHIINATQLAHFDENLPLVLATDASSFGIGVVLSHLQPDGGERPIVFASKTLDKHQVKYSQIEKEGLSIIFGVKRFHQYLYGRKFILITDHKPLVTIFNPGKHLPLMTSNRIQRWAIILLAYNFDIQYRSTSAHGNADALSRLPVGTDPDFDKEEEACHTVVEVSTPINSELICNHMDKDELLKQVLHFFKCNNPTPHSLGGAGLLHLKMLHDQSWPAAKTAWERIHIDFAGPIFDAMWLICVDAYSQFTFVIQMSSTTTANTIAALSSIFAIEGYPKTMVSDNRPQLTANAFEEFCKLHGIKHVTTAPFHPASNGLAERFVQTFTPKAQGKTPAELIHGRPVRTVLSQLFEKPVEAKQTITKYIPNQMVYARNYSRGEKWIEGIIDRPVGKMLFIVRTSNGYIKRHFNQLKPKLSTNNSIEEPPEFWWIPELPKPSLNQETQRQEQPPTPTSLPRVSQDTLKINSSTGSDHRWDHPHPGAQPPPGVRLGRKMWDIPHNGLLFQSGNVRDQQDHPGWLAHPPRLDRGPGLPRRRMSSQPEDNLEA